MYGSSIQHGSPGAVANVNYQPNYQTNDSNLQNLIEQLKTFLETSEISQIKKGELNADISTVEAQIALPQPKASIITESLRSIRSIVESAAGSILAPQIIHEISKYLG